MLYYALTFFVVALVAAVLGLGGVAGLSVDIGRLLLLTGIVVLVVGVLARAIAGGSHRALP